MTAAAAAAVGGGGGCDDDAERLLLCSGWSLMPSESETPSRDCLNLFFFITVLAGTHTQSTNKTNETRLAAVAVPLTSSTEMFSDVGFNYYYPVQCF